MERNMIKNETILQQEYLKAILKWVQIQYFFFLNTC